MSLLPSACCCEVSLSLCVESGCDAQENKPKTLVMWASEGRYAYGLFAVIIPLLYMIMFSIASHTDLVSDTLSCTVKLGTDNLSILL